MRPPVGNRYPWSKWLDGEIHSHTPTNLESFRNYLYKYSVRKEVYVTSWVVGNEIRFQFFDSLEERQNNTILANKSLRLERENTWTPPECRVCSGPLKPLDVEFGECREGSYIERIPLHKKEDND
jgi:hypothetical protein